MRETDVVWPGCRSRGRRGSMNAGLVVKRRWPGVADRCRRVATGCRRIGIADRRDQTWWRQWRFGGDRCRAVITKAVFSRVLGHGRR